VIQLIIDHYTLDIVEMFKTVANESTNLIFFDLEKDVNISEVEIENSNEIEKEELSIIIPKEDDPLLDFFWILTLVSLKIIFYIILPNN
jgi:hypothetical protein